MVAMTERNLIFIKAIGRGFATSCHRVLLDIQVKILLYSHLKKAVLVNSIMSKRTHDHTRHMNFSSECGKMVFGEKEHHEAD